MLRFTVLLSTIEPFAYVIRDHISYDGIQKGNKLDHLPAPTFVKSLGCNRQFYDNVIVVKCQNLIKENIQFILQLPHGFRAAVRFYLCLSPHSHIISRIGISDFPRSVRLYSTFGGI